LARPEEGVGEGRKVDGSDDQVSVEARVARHSRLLLTVAWRRGGHRGARDADGAPDPDRGQGLVLDGVIDRPHGHPKERRDFLGAQEGRQVQLVVGPGGWDLPPMCGG
jgi:hypothetical protein